MIRRIKKVAVLGAGVMGAAIACHFANAGLEVLLLDIVPRELTEEEKQKGLTLQDKQVRNRIVNQGLERALKTKPSPIYHQSFVKRITTGNFEDDMPKIKDYDWVIEVVVERLDIKQKVFEQVEKYRRPGTLVTTNTSGISIEKMIEGRSEDFQKHFCGTHFFNPPRYLPLLEIIPSSKTLPEVIDFLTDFASRILGKTPVIAKDTPAFIANRIGTFAIMDLLNNVKKFGFTITELDKLTGTIIGNPKSATFRTADVVGLDTLVHVANYIKENTNDEKNDSFKIPDYLQKLVENNWLGQKSGQGFYKKVKQDGKTKYLSIDFDTLEYKEDPKPKFDIFEKAKAIDDLRKRLPVLLSDKGKVGEFYRYLFYSLFEYSSNRIPEITGELYKIDEALKAGFGRKLGPFEAWDALGVEQTVKAMEEQGFTPAPWVYDMLKNGYKSFYKIENGLKYYYDIYEKTYKLIPGQENKLSLEVLRPSNIIWENDGASIFDLGDGVIAVEFHTKMNTIGAEVLAALNKALDLAEEKYQAVVIYNEGEHFSAGANVGMIYMLAVEQEYDELAAAVRWFQRTTMRLRYSPVPVIAAPHGMTLGGGTEICMHADKVIAHAETYMGLVEIGVGVIPGGGGTKEFALRLGDELKDGDVRVNRFQQRLMTIAQAKVSTSAYEAFDLGYLRPGVDEVIISRAHQLAYAKQVALNMAKKGYVQPAPRRDVKVLGREGLGLVYVGTNEYTLAHYMSEHDKFIVNKLGWVLSGGDLTRPLSEVDEWYLLDLERQAFVELCMQRKTLERMQSLITTGKIIRN